MADERDDVVTARVEYQFSRALSREEQENAAYALRRDGVQGLRVYLASIGAELTGTRDLLPEDAPHG